jgi:FtsH-binding integral membrane protein
MRVACRVHLADDTSLIIHHLGPDDYIIGAVMLYLDIINLFLYLLELLRMLQGGD